MTRPALSQESAGFFISVPHVAEQADDEQRDLPTVGGCRGAWVVTGAPRPRPPLYNPDFEHDACGTGFVADSHGRRTHRLVASALEALANLSHRGAESSDASGDGAGVTIQIPHALLAGDAERLGLAESELDRLAIASVFLPTDRTASDEARARLEAAAASTGVTVLGWRPVPTDPSALGGLALASMPVIEQLLLARPDELDPGAFERALYLARRRAERAYRESRLDAYVASMSGRTVVYKGLMLADAVGRFYPDLTDERTRSALALFHQRFATNTLPNWKLAQPFRRVAHNGEINTLLGNRNWMSAREAVLSSSVWGEDIRDLIPVVTPIGSDTASLDEALDLLASSGRDVLEAMAILVPEAWESMPGMDRALRAFYQYHACVTEPWDGPAALAFTDGRFAAAAVDRNGLRPARWELTEDGLVVLASEVGVLALPPDRIRDGGRVGPGEMIAVDTERGLLLSNEEIKRELAGRRPYEAWVVQHLTTLPRRDAGGSPTHAEEVGDPDPKAVERLQVLHGYTKEELSLVLGPMATDGKEPTGSMGDDSPLSAVGGEGRLLYSYFRQRFAQVTNPAIDSLRERIVMSLDMYLGPRGSLLDPSPEAARLVRLSSPVLLDSQLRTLMDDRLGGLELERVPATFPADGGAAGLALGLEAMCAAADDAVARGVHALVVSDREAGPESAPIPMLLAVSTLHHHLIRNGRRTSVSLLAEAGDARDVHHFATLIGFGASAVNPYLAIDSVRALAAASGSKGPEPDTAVERYVVAVEAGILKIMAKMGISAVTSYHGAQIFEALGLSDALVERSFPGTTSRIGGIGLETLAEETLARHALAFDDPALERGAWYKYRRNGEYHANEPPVWRALHGAVAAEGAEGGGAGPSEEYRAYADLVHGRPPTALRDLLELSPDREPIELERVEPVSRIVRRFQTGAMSLGALSAEAHEDIARAMNSLGALSNTGEGGEDPERYAPDGTRRDANAPVKQVASGRFGVTPAYLAAATEIEIKIAQGSKPGEGGQLPGAKVSPYIATLRHVRPGTPLISPPPHHDIYSIEDLAQLVSDLKTANPAARVAVKLVSAEGVGTIAAGVAKAYADTVHISGADGGTGASPLSSIKYAGDPWELGLAEAQQVLVMNGLRGRVTLSTDGGLHTGRDVVKAALLGAERYGFGTAALIAIGCKMARQCHVNSCPVGIATQAEQLREKYFGTPEMLVRFFVQVAGEVREILAWLGYERLDDVVGRADLLRQRTEADGGRWRGLDLSKLTAPPLDGERVRVVDRNDRPGTHLDDRIMETVDMEALLEQRTRAKADVPIRNTDRTVGTRISGRIARALGDRGLPAGSLDLTFTGWAGQSFGAWLVNGVTLHLVGEANDYVGKGMAGGEITVRPPGEHTGPPRTVVGNTVLYGATGGELYVAGKAGERFAVRNSGACAVVEGVGMHCCEYMTGGVVAVLGRTGRNFAAGMSGGTAFVLDEEGDFTTRLNHALVAAEPLSDAAEIELLRSLIERHRERTGSPRARDLLRNWPRALPLFWRVAPPGGRVVREDLRAASRAWVRSIGAAVEAPNPTPAP